MSDEGNNVLAFRSKSKPIDEFLIDDDPACASAEGIRLFVAWAMAMRAEGHMPHEVMSVVNRLFSEYWKTAPPCA
jgi:hypothetical protein